MLATSNFQTKSANRALAEESSVIHLPKPNYSGELSLEEALLQRRSIRSYENEALQLSEVGQLLWAAQGITTEDKKRTAPSAGALYPLKIYLATAQVEGLTAGVYQYDPIDHSLLKICEGDKRKQLSIAALMQNSIRHCAAALIFAANYRHVLQKYFEKGKRYVHMEAGHAAQNVCLQAVPLHIGTVTMGAFLDGPVKKILQLPKKEEVLYLMPVGRI